MICTIKTVWAELKSTVFFSFFLHLFDLLTELTNLAWRGIIGVGGGEIVNLNYELMLHEFVFNSALKIFNFIF